MPAHLLTRASVLMCPHGGTVQITTSNTRAKAGGDFIARMSDTYTIAGCPLNIAGAPHPCVRVQWLTSAVRSQVVSDPPLTESSVGLCLAGDQAPQGTVLIQTTQARVSGD
jgi:hypothetical protein